MSRLLSVTTFWLSTGSRLTCATGSPDLGSPRSGGQEMRPLKGVRVLAWITRQQLEVDHRVVALLRQRVDSGEDRILRRRR